ncbi:MAG: zinc-dependent peptidase, partial [Ignavibacteria bacterium]|nr:zinc-dependent peptidase [Ignavibacteria bacterium]
MSPIISIVIIAIIIVFVFIWNRRNNPKWKVPKEPFPTDWKIILARYVSFYNSLSGEEKNRFEYKVQEFLLNCRITGIDTSIDLTDKLLLASSAVIPIFEFNDWKYSNIHEVLLYPAMFNKNFDTKGSGRRIAGMVGSGYMEGKMILSKPALRHGFKNESDK